MTGTSLIFLALGLVGILYFTGFIFTLYEFNLMKRKPEEFPKTFQHLHPED